MEKIYGILNMYRCGGVLCAVCCVCVCVLCSVLYMPLEIHRISWCEGMGMVSMIPTIDTHHRRVVLLCFAVWPDIVAPRTPLRLMRRGILTRRARSAICTDYRRRCGILPQLVSSCGCCVNCKL